jgi:hypothetical protein
MTTNGPPRLRLLPTGAPGPRDVAVLGDRLIIDVTDGRVLSVAPDGARAEVLCTAVAGGYRMATGVRRLAVLGQPYRTRDCHIALIPPQPAKQPIGVQHAR